MKQTPKLNALMPTKWHFGHVVFNLMNSLKPRLNNNELAAKAGVDRNTVGNVINGTYSPNPETQQKLAHALETTAEAINAEVARLNAIENVVPLRSGKDRDYDKDPILGEAEQYARRIAALPRFQRMTLYSIVAMVEDLMDRK